MIVRLQQWHETWYLIVVSKVYEAAFQMIVRFIGCCLMVISLAIPALAKQRHALLIGNEAYAPEVGRLKNPANDVRLIAASLQQVGFAEKNITVVTNADRAAVLEAVEEYADRLANAGKDAVGFFYYSGHGAANQRDKSNYLIPVGVKRLDSRVWYKAIALNRVISRLSNIASNAAHFVVFDACRNILKSPTRGTKGFVPVSERRGMLIAFSTDPGETATDEGEGSGPYAAALAKELVRRGQHHLDVFQNVKEAVYQKTKTQVPWTRDGMLQRVYLAGTQRQLLAEQESRARSRIDLAYWDAVKDRQDPVLFRQYIKRFPTGTFVDLARQLAERLEKAEQTKLTSLQREAELRLAEERRQRAEISKQLAEQREADAKKAQELERARQQAEKARAALKAAETKRLAAENAVKQAEAARLGS
ncbi:MAG: caspase family protein, partial [Pseudomonadota bacterium]